MCLESDHQRSICTIRVHNTAETPLKQHLTFVKVKWSRSVWLFVAPWTVAHHAPPSMEFSRQEYWSGWPFPSPGDLPDPRDQTTGLPHCRQTLYRLSHPDAKLLQSCQTLSDPMDCSPPASSVHGILQARVLEWVAVSFSIRKCTI